MIAKIEHVLSRHKVDNDKAAAASSSNSSSSATGAANKNEKPIKKAKNIDWNWVKRNVPGEYRF